MTWALIFILSYNDPNLSQGGDTYKEHATVSSPTYLSEAECQAAASAKLASLNWSSDDGSQLRWVCKQSPSATF